MATKKKTAKPSAKKKPAAKAAPAKKGVLRGVALVDAVMKFRAKKGEKLVGVPAKKLDAMTLGGRPLSPALKAWLAADAKSFTLSEPTTLPALLRDDFGEYLVEDYAEVSAVLPQPIVVFEGWGADSRRFMYLGKTDAYGEYTVMTIDTDDTPFLCVNGPVDVWLAQHTGFLEAEDVYGQVPKEYAATKKEHGKLNFNGFTVWEFMDFA